MEDEGVDGEELLEKVFDSRRGIARLLVVAQFYKGEYIAAFDLEAPKVIHALNRS